MDAQEPLALGRVDFRADEFVEVRTWGGHSSVPSSSCASRESALRVRVFTVPRGIPSESAISLCESPRQYASSMTGRSCAGRISSARCTCHACQDASARSSGPGSSPGSSGTWSACSGVRRWPSMIASGRPRRPRARPSRAGRRRSSRSARPRERRLALRPPHARGHRGGGARDPAPPVRSAGRAPRMRAGRRRRSARWLAVRWLPALHVGHCCPSRRAETNRERERRRHCFSATGAAHPRFAGDATSERSRIAPRRRPS